MLAKSAALAVGAVLVLSACAGAGSGTSQSATPSAASFSATTVVASVESRGGLCSDGNMCTAKFTVTGDKKWVSESGGVTDHGNVPGPMFDALVAAVGSTKMMDAPPFTETCPVAYDGTAMLYKFTKDDGLVSVDSCEKAIAVDDPLVVALNTVQQSAVAERK